LPPLNPSSKERFGAPLKSKRLKATAPSEPAGSKTLCFTSAKGLSRQPWNHDQRKLLWKLCKRMIMPADRREYQKEYRKKYKTRSRRVTVVYSADEFKMIEKEAATSEAKLASLIRDRSLSPSASISAQKGKSAADEIVKELRFLLRNVANNMNQMAYHSHRLRQVLDENEPLLALARLEEQMTEILRRGA
jgi:hypothetical protein